MQLAWEALLAQARMIHNLVQAQSEGFQVQQGVTQPFRVTAEAMLIAKRGAQGGGDLPCQDDELLAWYHDAHGVAVIAKASAGQGNAEVECEVMVDIYPDIDEDGPHTPPIRCGVECCSTPPKEKEAADDKMS